MVKTPVKGASMGVLWGPHSRATLWYISRPKRPHKHKDLTFSFQGPERVIPATTVCSILMSVYHVVYTIYVVPFMIYHILCTGLWGPL